MKKLLVLLIPLFVGAVLLLGFRFISSSKAQVAALQVTATPQAEVLLNNTSLGKTPLYNDKLKPGSYTLKLVPQGQGLLSFEEKLTLQNGILTVVDRIFKSTEAESEESIISLENAADKRAVEIAVLSSPDGAEVKLDEQPQGVTPLLIKDVSLSDHQITTVKEGYNKKTLRVRPQEGYRLTVFVKLSIGRMIEATPTPVEKEEGVVEILETPTGFLRVREEPSISSKELTRVRPGENFPLIEEKEGWYKVALPDGKEGWVSKQYATLKLEP